MRVTLWTMECIKEFREWHEKTINELYANDLKLQMELRMDREQWLVMVLPRK